MSPLARLVPCVLRYRRRFLLGLLCLVCTTTFSLLGPWVLRHAVDDLTAGVTTDKLAIHAATLLGLAMAGGGFRFLTRRILVGASRAIEYDLRNVFVAHLQRLPLAYFHATRTGDLMSRATNDLNAVRMMVGPAVMYMASTGLVFVVAVALMLSIDPVLTLAALACLPVVSVAVKFFGTAVYRRTERIQAQLSTLSAVVQESLAGVRVVRAYCREGVEAERFGRENREYFARNAQLIRIQALFYPSLGFILGLAGVLVLWLGARHVIEGRITVGEFVAFNAYLLMLSWPMIAFGFVTNLFQRGMAAWGRMCEVLDARPAEPDPAARVPPPEIEDEGARPAGPDPAASRPPPGAEDEGARPVEPGPAAAAGPAEPAPVVRATRNRAALRSAGAAGPAASSPEAGDARLRAAAGAAAPPGPRHGFAGGIELRDLSFAYVGKPVLRGVSAAVEPGRVLGVIGPTGSGKSTLLALLPRLFNPPRGTVFIDGVDVLDLPLPVLRRQIAMVPQDPFLFSDTIAGNVSFGVEAAGGPGTQGGMADGIPRATGPAGGPGADRGIPDAGGPGPHGGMADGIPRATGPAGGPGAAGGMTAGADGIQAAAGAAGGPGAAGSMMDAGMDRGMVDSGTRGPGGVETAAPDGGPGAAHGAEKMVAEAIALARLDPDLAQFPDGAATRVGERGVTLSGGQKQRTALARAIAADARILLLDDALSSVDARTEADILANLRRALRGRTTIVVSHRISTVRAADLILVLDEGRVVERGAHDELVARNGLYAGLHRKQLIEQALEQG